MSIEWFVVTCLAVLPVATAVLCYRKFRKAMERLDKLKASVRRIDGRISAAEDNVDAMYNRVIQFTQRMNTYDERMDAQRKMCCDIDAQARAVEMAICDLSSRLRSLENEDEEEWED